MAEEVYETDARDSKAWRRVIAASRKLAKQLDNVELGEAVANSHHQDVSTRSMRRSESVAELLEAMVAGGESGTSGKAASKTTGKPASPAASE